MSLPKHSAANGSAHAIGRNAGCRQRRRCDYSRLIKAACEAWLLKNEPGYSGTKWKPIKLRRGNE